MKGKSHLLLPPPALAGCLFGAIVRDTRGAGLSDDDRLNFFPASPLVCMTVVLEGDLRLLPDVTSPDPAAASRCQPARFVIPPQQVPVASWSPGPLHAIALGMFPDAVERIGDPQRVLALLETAFGRGEDLTANWAHFCAGLVPIWQAADAASDPGEVAVGRISRWVRGIVVRATLSGHGRGVRSIERRVRRWSGQSRRSLEFYSAFEDLHRLASRSRAQSLAELAIEAGYSDQSHMGRAVRRGTGFSPARLNELIATKEAFWCYRLLGERF